MDAVSNMPELLENILLELPIKSLLTVQRINKIFQATITGSPRLQQALFFKPLPGKPLNFELGSPVPRWLESPNDQMYHTVFANPFYETFRKMNFKVAEDPPGLNASAFSRPEASWRRMLVSQPPITTVPPAVNSLLAAECLISRSLGKYKSVHLYYYPFNHQGPVDIDKINVGLMLGDLDQNAAQYVYIDGAYSRNITIIGESQWKNVQNVWEVRRITGPQPERPLQAKEEDIQNDRENFSADKSIVTEHYESVVSQEDEEDVENKDD